MKDLTLQQAKAKVARLTRILTTIKRDATVVVRRSNYYNPTSEDLSDMQRCISRRYIREIEAARYKYCRR